MEKALSIKVAKEWTVSSLSWIAILYFYYFIVFMGYKDLFIEGPFKSYAYSAEAHLEVLLQGFFFGLFFSIINTFVEEYSPISKRSFGQIILIKSLLYIFAILVVIALVLLVFFIFDLHRQIRWQELARTAPVMTLVSFLSYLLFFILFINFIHQASRKFGRGVLWSMILGKYSSPKVESRIFMFIDMKNSTALAEKLGHKKYSLLLRNCYSDLNKTAYKFGARIYQYVGDEVVISWKISTGLKSLNCIRAFFHFKNRISKRSTYYQTHFNIVPVFKAGMDTGVVTVAEIGEIKREIAYHGTVLNTASRIQEMCNNLKAELLISESVLRILPSSKDFWYEKQCDIELRGKSDPVNLYKVMLPVDNQSNDPIKKIRAEINS